MNALGLLRCIQNISWQLPLINFQTIDSLSSGVYVNPLLPISFCCISHETMFKLLTWQTLTLRLTWQTAFILLHPGSLTKMKVRHFFKLQNSTTKEENKTKNSNKITKEKVAWLLTQQWSKQTKFTKTLGIGGNSWVRQNKRINLSSQEPRSTSPIHSVQPGNYPSPTNRKREAIFQKQYKRESFNWESPQVQFRMGNQVKGVVNIYTKCIAHFFPQFNCQDNMANGQELCASEQPSVKAPKIVYQLLVKVSSKTSSSDAQSSNPLSEHLDHYKFIRCCKIQYREVLCVHHSASPNATS